jgi:hypothetical protein
VQVDIGELQAGIVEDHHGAGPQAHVESAVDPAGDTPYYAVAAVGYTDGGAVCWLPQAPALPPSAVKFEMEMLPSCMAATRARTRSDDYGVSCGNGRRRRAGGAGGRAGEAEERAATVA